MKVLIYGQYVKEKDLPYINELNVALEKLAIEVNYFGPFYKKVKKLLPEISTYDMVSTNQELLSFNPNYVITMGGDGTILTAATFVKDSRIPILGINLGRLGFLASIEKKDIGATLEEITKGNLITEERSLLWLSSNIDIFSDTKFALNDFTITKRDNSSMIKIKTYIDDQLLNTYWADGIIVATPTGSTGYSLSCGGPIIFPNSENFVITPIAPHNLNVRPVVIPDYSKIKFVIEGRSENFMCTLDSRFETITKEHIIEISKCDFKVKLTNKKGSNFMDTIRSKLVWGLDMRN